MSHTTDWPGWQKQSPLIRLHYGTDGEVEYSFLHYTGNGFIAEEQGTLYQSPCQPEDSDIPVNQVKVPCLPASGEEPAAGAPEQADSVRIAAGAHYTAGALHRFFFLRASLPNELGSTDNGAGAEAGYCLRWAGSPGKRGRPADHFAEDANR
ncbi:MAG: hypothetical protein H6560_04060 [Lewinellaceae bacterium]|nr:hypothetical protein [Lewinellaceae bacterium]